ncbi:MAG: precorrin-3B C(17)-methyltransferase [Oscillospiraceae bacterium]|nr:precorrin-3B C(17)-methyltransferase [Oscillospiraceae bacterium]MBQ4000729.1 precorrin-3B C(17)-methyltransferase [Oscillospiraceae bacterium]MBQ4239899.1 precorrin-3B C(17)-methyltransferase [Oscillospiraceae bacterium]
MKKLIVAGIGAGNYDGLTVAAIKALEGADIIVGYTVYCDLIKPYFPDKEFLSTPMMREIERCRIALEHAASGKLTVMICSGDSGIYGMASPVLELASEYGVEVEVIPGVTAAASGAALLGSPITCDFAVISLSDLLTPMERIEKRLEGAAMADLCIVLYNPSSRKRADYLMRACDIVLKYRSPETVCGIARNIGREGESSAVLTLAELRETATDMFTTVFIGNSETKVIDGHMVTPRGYRNE